MEKKVTCNFFNAVSTHVKQHTAIDDATPELKQTVKGESGDIRLAPPFATILHVLLKLQPPVRKRNRGLYL